MDAPVNLPRLPTTRPDRRGGTAGNLVLTIVDNLGLANYKCH